MSGGSGPTPFCHGVQGTKRSVYSGGCVSRDWVDVECRSIKGPTAASEGCTASGGLVLTLAWLSTGGLVILKMCCCRSPATIQNHISS
jgi:hypothetical protein